MSTRKKSWIAIGVILTAAFIILNCVLVFKEDSIIARSYYITDYERMFADHEKAYLEKDAILVPEEEIRIAVEADALSEISVRQGQAIAMSEEIAVYKTEEAEQEQSRLQSELYAYEQELSTLQGILTSLQATSPDNPLTTIDSQQIDEELSVVVETEISQGSPTEAIAVVEQQIAEVERNIEIVSSQISNLNFSNVLSSPVDGVIGKVEEDGGTVTFVLYTTEKNLITYISEDEWKQVEENQLVELEESLFANEEESEPNNGDEGQIELGAEEAMGTVVEKQSIPASNSTWLNEMQKVREMPEPTSFEVRIDPEGFIQNKPYASLTKTKIILNEAQNAFRVNGDMIMTKKAVGDSETDEITEESFIYTIGQEEGKIELTPVEVAFDDKEDTIFTGNVPDGQIVLEELGYREFSQTFFPMPMTLPNKAMLESLSWKDYVKYLIQ